MQTLCRFSVYGLHTLMQYAQIVRLPKPSLELCNLYQQLKLMDNLFHSQLEQKEIQLILPEIDSELTNFMADKIMPDFYLVMITPGHKYL